MLENVLEIDFSNHCNWKLREYFKWELSHFQYNTSRQIVLNKGISSINWISSTSSLCDRWPISADLQSFFGYLQDLCQQKLYVLLGFVILETVHLTLFSLKALRLIVKLDFFSSILRPLNIALFLCGFTVVVCLLEFCFISFSSKVKRELI